MKSGTLEIGERDGRPEPPPRAARGPRSGAGAAAPRHVRVVQPALASYRVDFFDRVARTLGPGFTVHHPAAQNAHQFGAMAVRPDRFAWQRTLGTYRRTRLGLAWHHGAVSIPLARGDVLVVPGSPRCISYLVLLARARLCGVRTVWWGHYWSASSRRWRFGLRLLLMRLGSGVLLYTDAEVERFSIRAGPRLARPVAALNNGIDTDPIRAHRAPYDPRGRGPVLLFLGRLTEKACLADLLAALSHPALATARLEIVGSGPGEERLRRAAHALGVGGRVTWHGTVVEERRIAEIANCCALFVYPGSVGLSLIHAMAYGLPAVVHDDRWRHMPEIAAFADGVTGLAFRAGDADALTRTVAAALADPRALARWSQASLARTADSYNTRAMARRFCAFVETVGRAGGAPGRDRC